MHSDVRNAHVCEQNGVIVRQNAVGKPCEEKVCSAKHFTSCYFIQGINRCVV